MPEFPDFIAQEDLAQPAIPSANPAAGAIFPEAIQRGAAEVGQTADEFLARATDLQREQKNTAAILSSLPQVTDAANQASLIPDRALAESTFLAQGKTILQSATQGETDPFVVARVQAELGHTIADMAGRVSDRAFDQQRSAQAATLDASAQTSAQSYAQTSDPAARQTILDAYNRQLDAAAASHLIEPEQAQLRREQFTSKTVALGIDEERNAAIRSHDPLAMSALAAKVSDEKNYPGLLEQDRQQLAGHFDNLAWRYEAASQAAQAHQDAMAERWLRQAQASNEASLIAGSIAGQRADPITLANAVRTQQITPTGYNAILTAEAGRDDPRTVVDMNRRLGTGELTSDDIMQGLVDRSVSKETAVTLQRALNERQTQGTNATERGAFATLKTAVGGDAVEKGLVDIGDTAKQAQVQTWAQAQAEWTKRVVAGREDPQAVLSDMLPRYQHLDAATPALWAPPALGSIQSKADVVAVAQKTQAAFDAGQLAQPDFDRQKALIARYGQFYDQQAQRAAAAASVPRPTSGGAQLRGVTPAEGNP